MTTLHDVGDSATSVVVDDHEQINAALARVSAAIDGPTRELLLAFDTVLGLLSRHLLGMEVAVCPVVVRRMEGGGRIVRSHLTDARRLETTMQQMGQVLWGDALAPHVPLEALQRRLLAEMATHRDEEHRMLTALDAVLTPSERPVLAAKLRHATLHAPTRPHPYAVRRLAWTRALYRPVAEFDRLRDMINSRMVPPPPYGRRRERRVGLWGSYLLGVPLSSRETEAEAEPADDESGNR